jgi:ABC-type sugar transport system permease subunit
VTGFGLVALGGTILVKSLHPTESRAAYLFLIPSFLHLSIFVLTPLLLSLILACCHWDFLSSRPVPVGLSNFRELLSDSHFWRALKNTALFALNVPVTTAVALLIAEGLHRWGLGGKALQAAFFLPNVCLIAAVAVVWRWIYNPEIGALNVILLKLGVHSSIPWLASVRTVLGIFPLPLLSVMLMWIWMHVGVQSVIFRGSLSKVPASYYEAAALDGAAPWQSFFYVTVPLLRPAIVFVLVTSVIASFQVFTAVYVMIGKAVMRTRAVDVLVYRIYEEAWGPGARVGYACAMSWMLFLLLLAATVVQFKGLKVWREGSST